jgi:hypothetical protein
LIALLQRFRSEKTKFYSEKFQIFRSKYPKLRITLPDLPAKRVVALEVKALCACLKLELGDLR